MFPSVAQVESKTPKRKKKTKSTSTCGRGGGEEEGEVIHRERAKAKERKKQQKEKSEKFQEMSSGTHIQNERKVKQNKRSNACVLLYVCWIKQTSLVRAKKKRNRGRKKKRDRGSEAMGFLSKRHIVRQRCSYFFFVTLLSKVFIFECVFVSFFFVLKSFA